MTTLVLTALPGGVEADVVQALGDPAARAQVVRRCADLAELLAATAAGLGSVAVVSTELPGVDREAVRHLHGSGCWVVVVGHDPGRSLALGADAVLPADRAGAGAADVLGRLAAAAERGEAPGRGPVLDEPTAPDPPPVPTTPGSRGAVVAVWGPTGAPGRTTVALGMAAELAQPTGATALLADADTYGGVVAAMVGVLDEAPGLAAAARLAGNGTLDVAALARLSPVLDGGLRLLTGISRADRWPELPASGLEVVWDVCRSLAAWTVVDCGFCLEQDEVLSYDTRAPGRNAATLSALAAADVVVAVGAGDPIGLQRLVRGLDELAEAGVGPARRVVVVNRVRTSASGPRPGQAIADALHRYAGVPTVHLVPDDRAACDGAVLAGRTLREHAPASPVRRALADLAAVVTARASSGARLPSPVASDAR